ncbi:MAG: hypothetical protein KF729_05005 [Sandaracinaceae bacterium]|nr:hypothetical protein [Sandaracinaceae bacterium]
MRRLALALTLALAASACGTRPPLAPPPDVSEEVGAAPPRIAGIELPRLPIDVTPEDPALREGWSLATQALTMSAPRPPAGEPWEIETWADDALADWMRRRAEIIAAAQRALEGARQGRPDHSVVASTLLGLAYARFAMDLRGLETPETFRDDPERASAYRAAMESAARPLWQRALDAFGSCASVANGEPAHGLGRWRERCDREGREASSMLEDG